MDWRIIEGLGKFTFNQFSPKELATATGLTTDLQRVWRRRGHLPERGEGYASFDSLDVAAISVRYELSKMGVAPAESAWVGNQVGRTVLYFALLSNDCAASIRGGLKRLAAFDAKFQQDDELAQQISGAKHFQRYLWSSELPTIQPADDIAPLLSDEEYPAILHLDLVVIGKRLAQNSPKPLFQIDLKA